MKSYQDLEIYRESRRLALQVHALSMTLPKHEMYEEGSQLRRSSKSVTALIVEGFGRRRYKSDYIKYLVYSHCECDETIVHLDFLISAGSAAAHAEMSALKEDYKTLSKRINKFIQWLEENLKT